MIFAHFDNFFFFFLSFTCFYGILSPCLCAKSSVRKLCLRKRIYFQKVCRNHALCCKLVVQNINHFVCGLLLVHVRSHTLCGILEAHSISLSMYGLLLAHNRNQYMCCILEACNRNPSLCSLQPTTLVILCVVYVQQTVCDRLEPQSRSQRILYSHSLQNFNNQYAGG